MSSMGPLVYVIAAADRGESTRGELEGICAAFGANYVGMCRFRNAGFEIDR
jgi:predicted sugar kinase